MAIVKPLILEDGETKTAGTGDQVPQTFVEGLPEFVSQSTDKVEGLETDLNTLDGKVEGLETDLNTLDGKVEGLETDLNTLDGKVEGLETDLNTLDGKVEGLETDLNTLDGKVEGLETDLNTLDEHFHSDLEVINNTIQAMSTISLRLEEDTVQRFPFNSGSTQLKWNVKSQSNQVESVEVRDDEIEFKIEGNFLFNTDFQVARTNQNAPTKFNVILKNGETTIQVRQLESSVIPGDNVHLSLDTLVETTEGMILTVFIQPTNGTAGDLSIQRLDSYMVSQSVGTNVVLEDATSTVKGIVRYGKEESTAVEGNDSRLQLISLEGAKLGESTEVQGWSAERVHAAILHLTSDELKPSILSYNYVTDIYDVTNVRETLTHKHCRRCLVQDDGTVSYYLDPHDSTKKEDGSPADLSGVDGQVMVEIPRFWCGSEFQGNQIKITQSPVPFPGLQIHPVFQTETGSYKRIFLGAYQASVQQPNGTIVAGLNLDNNTSRVNLSTGKLSSLSGGNNFPMVGLDLSEFRQLARNRGEGWDSWSFLAWQAVQMLGYTFLGTFNGQDALGDGNVNKTYLSSSSKQAQSPHKVSGLSNGLGNGSGASQDFMSLLGIENVWGGAYQWVDGVLLNSMQTHITYDPSKSSDTITDDYTPLGSVISVGDNGSWHYIEKFQELGSGLFLVGAGGGNSSKFVGDGCYPQSGLRGALVGGGAYLGERGGLACLRAALAPGDRGRDLGGRVMLRVVEDHEVLTE